MTDLHAMSGRLSFITSLVGESLDLNVLADGEAKADPKALKKSCDWLKLYLGCVNAKLAVDKRIEEVEGRELAEAAETARLADAITEEDIAYAKTLPHEQPSASEPEKVPQELLDRWDKREKASIGRLAKRLEADHAAQGKEEKKG